MQKSKGFKVESQSDKVMKIFVENLLGVVVGAEEEGLRGEWGV